MINDTGRSRRAAVFVVLGISHGNGLLNDGFETCVGIVYVGWSDIMKNRARCVLRPRGIGWIGDAQSFQRHGCDTVGLFRSFDKGRVEDGSR